MISRTFQNARAWFDCVSLLSQPPKDPNDDDEDEEDDEDEDEQDEPDIREPDE